MASGENPFSAMVDVIREEVRRGSGPSWNMGEVVSTAPLQVRYQGVLLNADQVAAAGQWAAQLKVGDSVPVLPDRDDGRFVIMQPADSAAFASAEHDHDALYAGLAHNHDALYAGLAHAHGEISNDGKIGSTANLIIATGTAGLLEAKTSEQIAAILKPILLEMEHPIGSIWESEDSTSPATLFGGTWSTYGAGRVIVGLDSSDADFDTAGETQGTKTNTHTVSGAAQLFYGTGNALIYAKRVSTSEWTNNFKLTGGSNNVGDTTYTGSYGTGVVGSAAASSIVQPSIVLYRWKRTA